MAKKDLSAKEWLFCRYFIRTNNAREAAARAGYLLLPEKSGERLLKKDCIKKEIRKMLLAKKLVEKECETGLKRLAFGNITDAIKLILQDDISVDDLEKFDLYNISEIKKAKGGGVEIKFFDRLKALEKLSLLEDSANESVAESFFSALRQENTDEN